MDYEKRYKEACKLLRELYPIMNDYTKKKIADIVPELKESENERIRKHLIAVVELYYGKTDEQEKKDCLAWLEKQGEKGTNGNEREFPISEPKPAWSEEDEDYYDAIIAKLEVTQDDALLTDNQMRFLKSIKDRVQPQQEWSEEDEEMLEELLNYCDTSIQYNGINSQQAIKWKKRKEWLKSIRLKSQWKPSETELRVFEEIIDGIANPCNYHATLHAMLEQLKKLREE